jgi:hypothetical protein
MIDSLLYKDGALRFDRSSPFKLASLHQAEKQCLYFPFEYNAYRWDILIIYDTIFG